MNGHMHHIEIYVSDLRISKQFYDWLLSKLGYTLYQDWDKGFSFKKEDFYIVFVQVEMPFEEFGYHRKRIGLNHMAFKVYSESDVDELTAELIEKNIPILYKDKHPFAGGTKHYAVYFENPDRIKLEVVSHT